MNTLRNGEYFGKTNDIVTIEELTITDTEYTHPYVDWHYHENAYFTFLLQGNMIEGNKKRNLRMFSRHITLSSVGRSALQYKT
jgi:cupin superfamily acireductone dioxygenase involved in methionine salvage